ncbi:SusD/RagB family nutrient-binding outer membrane lipoprotein [Reichenbachiella carrageenanivorans]|uniref:SusD/RagB family nutrient-binding outer membrane lipoprotein n=1 Tax=Reichenbachiella carrageenanivorans TaxID=2979869 RepID=A0ABY6CYS4_9BACT|nr:SusD/RagB family nutrient-binding outer membrane lipoprotein [Reichenbachiella carrageenanivorans]UXX78525.1 SusD/RagB family nutrient-binding outer membrane lipoprotein [Reichenbachiella carrageenanivorans]
MKLKILSSVLALTLVFSACSDWEEINTDPNNPLAEDVDPGLKVGSVFKEACLTAHLHQRIQNLYVDMFAQYYTGTGFATYTNNSVDGWTGDYWNEHYKWFNSLSNLVDQYEDSDSYTNAVAVIRIWRVWVTHRATDLMGDIPYSNVAEGVYDSEETIYKDMLNELEEAVASIDPDKAMFSDAIYQGDLTKWTLFANSLRLRLAMRISGVEPALAKQHAEAAVVGGVLETQANMPTMYANTAIWGEGYSYNYYFWWGSGNGVGMTSTFYDLTAGIGGLAFNTADVGAAVATYPAVVDPRATIIFGSSDQNADVGEGFEGVWSGIDAGLAPSALTAPENFVQNNSRMNTTLRGEFNGDNARSWTIMPIAEVWFLRAEGALNGWNMGKTAQEAYESGVAASFEYWGLSSSSTYLASNEVNQMGVSAAWGDGNGTDLEKVIAQKFIGGYPDNGWEAWADLRRLELPAVDFGLQSNTNVPAGKVIQRVKYPSSQAVLNEANYAQVADKDVEGTKHWWAK